MNGITKEASSLLVLLDFSTWSNAENSKQKNMTDGSFKDIDKNKEICCA